MPDPAVLVYSLLGLLILYKIGRRILVGPDPGIYGSKDWL